MILISACLAGINCRYDGKNNLIKEIKDLVEQGKAIIICPEILGGMKTPRIPAEITCKEGKLQIINTQNENVSSFFFEGARKTLEYANKNKVKQAILKSKSPSCGFKEIYDGTFTKTLKKGNGITAQILIDNGIEVCSEKDYKKIVGEKIERDK